MSETKKKQIAIGVEDFKTIIEKGGYFVDKTLMIQKLIESQAMVTLFVVGWGIPRRLRRSAPVMYNTSREVAKAYDRK